MGLFSKKRPSRAVTPVVFDENEVKRKYKYDLKGSYYETDDGPSGDKLIDEIINRQDGFFECSVKAVKHKGEPAIKVYFKDANGIDVHVGWMPKEKVASLSNMIKDGARSVAEVIYNETMRHYIIKIVMYWDK